MQIRLAHTCAICKHSVFKKGKYAYWPSKMSLAHTGKGHIGVCFLLCGEKPPRVRRPRYIFESQTTDNWAIENKSELDYITARMAGYRKRYCHREFYDPQGHKEDLHKYYRAWHYNYDWWQENFPLARRCHRALACESWKETTDKSRESAARQILSDKEDKI